VSKTRPTVGILEDDPHLRTYLQSLIAGSGDLHLAFSVGTIAEALVALDEAVPDLCLTDLNLPDGGGVRVIARIKQAPGAKVLVLSMLGDRATVLQVLQAGADGYLLKSGRADSILREVRQTLRGETIVSPQVAAYLLEMVRDTTSTPDKADASPASGVLTVRETEVLQLFARGLSYKESAERLSISTNTISDHVRKIYAKLSVHSRSAAVFEARTRGLIDPRGALKQEDKS